MASIYLSRWAKKSYFTIPIDLITYLLSNYKEYIN